MSAAAKTSCAFCLQPMSLGREFVFQVEQLNFAELFSGQQNILERLRAYAEHPGEPLRICEACHRSVEENLAALQAEQSPKKGLVDYLLYLVCGLGIAGLAAIGWASTRTP